jgi:hypothetical protein
MSRKIYDLLIADYRAGDQKFRQIDEEYANWMLECLPPARQEGWNFVNSEPYTHNAEGRGVFFASMRQAGKHYGILCTLAQWDKRELFRLPFVDDEGNTQDMLKNLREQSQFLQSMIDRAEEKDFETEDVICFEDIKDQLRSLSSDVEFAKQDKEKETERQEKIKKRILADLALEKDALMLMADDLWSAKHDGEEGACAQIEYLRQEYINRARAKKERWQEKQEQRTINPLAERDSST